MEITGNKEGLKEKIVCRQKKLVKSMVRVHLSTMSTGFWKTFKIREIRQKKCLQSCLQSAEKRLQCLQS